MATSASAIPDYERLMLPVLEYVAKQREPTVREVVSALADTLGLTAEQRAERHLSGNGRIFDNRTSWAITYLRKAALLESPRRGLLQITPRGVEALHTAQPINDQYLMQFAEFREWRRRPGGNSRTSGPQPRRETDEQFPVLAQRETPDEALDASFKQIRQKLADDLLDRVKASPPRLFEQLVVDLLRAMGYGGPNENAAAIGGPGDGGIDGLINEDPLGLDTIYIQAKRWQGIVGVAEVRAFAGALQGQRSRKGIFVITGNFAPAAKKFVDSIDNRIVLIDGEQLSGLMIDHDIGVSVVRSYVVKRIDSDYFPDDASSAM